MSSFIDLTKPELLATLQYDGRFRKWRTPLEAMEFKVVPPAQNLSQKDIQYVRLFFDIGRDSRIDDEDGS
ncbi:hypothetical protein [Breoghania sp.]|uniref:hypothetical protein n=1 Tax=Breoghania sp. TaxID=2065378 RepID=UPI00261FBD6C|nr:hypothetical protein [Breoghania sp.]MDJ0933380.1 hypothetical protein [Breoghania sp.]